MPTPDVGAPPGVRARARREQILAAAIELFRDRGYHAAGIDDIGAAAGISGPGVYRHFSSKQQVLVALFDRTTESRVAAARRVVDTTEDAAGALAALVDDHVRFALENRSLIAVYLQEGRSLPAADAHRIRGRQRQYLDHWVQMLRAVRPQLDDGEAWAIVHAAVGAVHSVALSASPLPAGRLRRLLTEAALRVLLASS